MEPPPGALTSRRARTATIRSRRHAPAAPRRSDRYPNRDVPAPRDASPELEESEDPLSILLESAALPANQRTELFSEDSSPLDFDPLAAFQVAATGLLDSVCIPW